MQKKVYAKDLSVDEIMERLNRGEKMYDETAPNCYRAFYHNVLILYKNNHAETFNAAACLDADWHYFLDEVEEPEADESCIGKLCKFWYNDNTLSETVKGGYYGFLGSIEYEHTDKYRASSGVFYKHCRPLTKEEALAFVKE